MDYCDALFEEFRRELDYDRLLVLLDRLLTRYKVITFELGSGALYWRARKCIRDSGYERIADVWAPRADLCGPGRLNDLGESVFYASTTQETALSEVNAGEGEYVHLIACQVPRRASIYLACAGEYLAAHRTGRSTFLPEGAAASIRALINRSGRRFLPLLYLDAFLADWLGTADAASASYVHTRAIGTALLEIDPRTAGILYPSVKVRGGRNLMLRRSAADDGLVVVASSVIRVDKVRSYGFIETTPIVQAMGVDADGAFRWTPARDGIMCLVFEQPEADFEELAQSVRSKGGRLISR